MNMTEGEIVHNYKLSKFPRRYIRIAADLNDCSCADIIELLQRNGCKLPEGINSTDDAGNRQRAPKQRSRNRLAVKLTQQEAHIMAEVIDAYLVAYMEMHTGEINHDWLHNLPAACCDTKEELAQMLGVSLSTIYHGLRRQKNGERAKYVKVFCEMEDEETE